MAAYRFVEVNVFSADPLAGNPLAVVHAASLAQWLIGAGRTGPSYVASQGHALGRAGRVYLRKDGGDVWVGGEVVEVVRGQIEL